MRIDSGMVTPDIGLAVSVYVGDHTRPFRFLDMLSDVPIKVKA